MTQEPLPLREVAARRADGEGAEPPLSEQHPAPGPTANPEPSAYDYAAPADVLAIVAQVEASADEQERHAIRLDRQTFGAVWPFALIPLGLVLIMANARLGDWVWVLWPVGFLAICAMLMMMPLRHRYASEQPLELPDALRLHGQRKRRFLLKLALIAGALFVGEALFRMYGGRLWEWTVPWPW